MKNDINIPLYQGEIHHIMTNSDTTIDSELFFDLCRAIIKKKQYNNIDYKDIPNIINNIKCSKVLQITSDIISKNMIEKDIITHDNLNQLMTRIKFEQFIIQRRVEELSSLCRWIIPCIPDVGMMNMSINIIVSVPDGHGMSIMSNNLYSALKHLSSSTEKYIKHMDDIKTENNGLITIDKYSILIFDNDINNAMQFNDGTSSIILFTSPDNVSAAKSALSKSSTTFILHMDSLESHDICEILSYEFNIEKDNAIIKDIDDLLSSGYSPRDIISSFKLASITEPFKKNDKNFKKTLTYNKSSVSTIISKISNNSSIPNISVQSVIKYITNRVHGQDRAIGKISSALMVAKFGLNRKNKPILVSLFMGPTGTGKTELAKAISSAIYGNNNIIHLNMAEFSEKHYIARLLGSPPGYNGHNKDPQFIVDLNNVSGNTVILFDEIEKAAPEVLQALLQIMDEGKMTTASGKKIDMTHCIIILTSNALSYKLGKKMKIGIGSSNEDDKYYNDNDIKELLINENILSPEFINRLDSISNFDYLDKETVNSIAKMHLDKLVNDLKLKDIKMTYTKKLLADIYNKYDKDFGGRSILRAIDQIKANAVEDITKQNNKIRARI